MGTVILIAMVLITGGFFVFAKSKKVKEKTEQTEPVKNTETK